MAAYPLLLALPLRFALPSAEKRSAAQPPVSTRRIHGIDPVLVEQFLALGIEYDPRKITQAVTRTVANAVPAEICLLVSTVDERKTLTIYGGYDVVRERYLDGLALRGEALPAVTSALRDGLPLYLSPAEPYLDLDTLSKALYLGPPGYLLCAPILADSGDTIAGLLLLSPYTRTGFAPAEQATLASFTNPLAQLLQRTQVLAAAAAVERAVAPAGRGEAREAPGAAEGYAPGGEPGPSEAYHLEAELRLALEEIARLKGSLSESDQQLLLMKNQMDVTYLSADQNQALVDTVQELRQTMAAVMGYTDFLLNESVGILGSLQRRFLERVKLSTERMNRLVDDLVQITSLKDVRRLIHFDPADLHEIIAEAIANTESQRTAKNITLHLDVPQELPQVCTDRIALQQVLTNLLDNAGEVTPADDEITLRAVVQSDDLDRQFFLIQVSDSGGGISIADIPRVFTRLPRGQAPHVFPGVSPDHNNLYIAKRLVDALSGRIWVDSEPNLGSTFSLLLQATPDGAGENGSGGPPA